MPRYHRPGTPHPTAPPPPELPKDTPPERLVKRLEPWKVLLAVGVTLIGIGVTFATWQATLVKQEQLHELKVEETSWRGSMQASTTAQLGSLQSQVHDLRERQAGIEADVHDLTRLTERLLDQTLEIAKATGAKQVPPAP